MSWERARSEEQKKIREEEILAAARGLLDKKPFHTITLSELAREVSFTRANLYKYFESREEVYLALLAREIGEFGERLFEEWKTLEGSTGGGVECFLKLWVPALAQEHRMMTLMSMAGTILEKNCSNRVLLKSKASMASASQTYFLPILKSFFPEMPVEALAATMSFLIITANGLFPFCGLSQEQKELLRGNGLEGIVHEFEKDYPPMIRAYLHSLETAP